MQVRLKGAPALLVVAAVVAFVGWWAVTARAELDASAREALTQQLQAEFAREHLARVGRVEELTPASVDSLLATQTVTFPSLTARGRLPEVIVRVEIRVDGRPPADAREVRYYRMSYSPITGWRIQREATAFAYHTTWF